MGSVWGLRRIPAAVLESAMFLYRLSVSKGPPRFRKRRLSAHLPTRSRSVGMYIVWVEMGKVDLVKVKEFTEECLLDT